MYMNIYIYIFIYFFWLKWASNCKGFWLKVPRPAWFCVAFSWQAGAALDLRWARLGPIVGHNYASCSGSTRNTATNR